jgi:hypothetical protein
VCVARVVRVCVLMHHTVAHVLHLCGAEIDPGVLGFARAYEGRQACDLYIFHDHHLRLCILITI